MAKSKAAVAVKAKAEPTEAEITAFAVALDEAIKAACRALRQAEINTANLRAARLENEHSTA